MNFSKMRAVMKLSVKKPKQFIVYAMLFDVDGVLAPPGAPISEETRQFLRELQAMNIKIVLVSGKPVAYLQGLARGMGLNETIIAGENSAVIFDPRQRLEITLVSRSFIERLKTLKEALTDTLSEQIWFQQNQVIVTVFPRGGASVKDIVEAARVILRKPQFKAIEMIQHIDAVDFVPRGLNKGRAVEVIAKILEISPAEMAAVGDSCLDVPMLKNVAISFATEHGDAKAKAAASYIIADLNEILQYIIKT